MSWKEFKLFSSRKHQLFVQSNDSQDETSTDATNDTSYPTTVIMLSNDIVKLITCFVNIPGQIILCDLSGFIYSYHINPYIGYPCKPFQKYKLFDNRILFATSLKKQSGTVIFIGNDVDNPYILKALSVNVDAYTFKYSIPLSRFVRNGNTIDIMAVSDSGQQIALGLSDGAVVLITIENHTEENYAELITSGRLLYPPQMYAISNLLFCDIPLRPLPNTPSSSKYLFETRLFISIDTDIFSKSATSVSASVTQNKSNDESMTIGIYTIDPTFLLTKRKESLPYVVLEEYRGIKHLCASVVESTCELLVAQPEALYLYSTEERGSALGMEGDKTLLYTFGMYTLIITTTVTSHRTADLVQDPATPAQHTSITIYHLRDRFICYKDCLDCIILQVSIDYSSLQVVLLTSTLEIIVINELSMEKRLTVFLETDLFETALSLAATSNAHLDYLVSVYKAYGDYLFDQGNIFEAYTQYSYTIGSALVPPSSIIQKFSQLSDRKWLIKYILILAENKLATKRHIDMFLLACTESNNYEEHFTTLVSVFLSDTQYFQNLFNVNKVVKVLVRYKRADLASQIADTFHSEEILLDMQQISQTPIEENNLPPYTQQDDYDNVNFIVSGILIMSRHIPRDDLIELLFRYSSKILENNNEQQFIALLLYFCSGKTSSDLGVDTVQGQPYALSVDDCVRCFHSKVGQNSLLEFLRVVNNCNTLTEKSAATLLELLLTKWKDLQNPLETDSIEVEIFSLLKDSSVFKSQECVLSARVILKDSRYKKFETSLLSR